jgi:predicted phage-related endonuclease
VQEPDLSEIEYVEWGNILEPAIASKYEIVTGRKLLDPGRFAIRTSTAYPHMLCTLDRIIDATNEKYGTGQGDLSIKNAGEFKRRDWEEEPPLPYQVQLQHEMCVTGLQWGSFAVLIGGNKFHWCDVPRNEKFISYLVEREEEFWDNVQRNIPPAPDGSDSTREVLLRLYPKDQGQSKELPLDAAEWIARRRAAKDALKAAQDEIQTVENLIKAAIGEASIGLVGGSPVISWKAQHREPYTVDAADFRVLREIKGKGKK